MQMPDEVFTRRPWHDLPPALAGVLRPRTDSIAAEMIDVIRDEVPDYRRPLDSAFGRDLAASVRRAIGQFVELTAEPHSRQEHHVRHFRTLGRLEFCNGRTTDALQAAFRVGARVGARLYAETARSASLPLEVVMPLHEAVLTHIDVLSNESVKGSRRRPGHGGGRAPAQSADPGRMPAGPAARRAPGPGARPRPSRRAGPCRTRSRACSYGEAPAAGGRPGWGRSAARTSSP